MTAVEEDTSVYVADLPIAPVARAGRRFSRSTTALAVLLLLVVGFFAGVKVQQREGGSSRSGTTNLAALARAAGARGPSGPSGASRQQQGTGGGATIGSVKLVDGDTIYVTTTGGNIVKVRTTKSGTTVTKTSTGTVSDVRPGDNVVVQGSAGEDGTVNATRVNDTGTGGFAGGDGFGGGGGRRPGGADGGGAGHQSG